MYTEQKAEYVKKQDEAQKRNPALEKNVRPWPVSHISLCFVCHSKRRVRHQLTRSHRLLGCQLHFTFEMLMEQLLKAQTLIEAGLHY